MKYQTFHDWIIKNLERDSNILEFGSGIGTSRLSEHFNMTSIEHDTKFVGLYDSEYIHAPIKNGWYDVSKLESVLGKKFDLILVDGPTGIIGRDGWIRNMNLFKLDDTIIIMDDLNRNKELEIYKKTLSMLGDIKTEIFTGIDRKFGVIHN